MLVKRYVAYLGIKEPSTKTQVMVEITGLRHVIEVAKEQISRLEQALAIAELQKEEVSSVEKEVEPKVEDDGDKSK